eukprot:3311966-Amphidinium_carterae.2
MHQYQHHWGCHLLPRNKCVINVLNFGQYLFALLHGAFSQQLLERLAVDTATFVFELLHPRFIPRGSWCI